MIPRDNSIYIRKNTIGVMSKMGFEYGFIGILSNECFGNSEKLLIMPVKHWDFCVVSDVLGIVGNLGSWTVSIDWANLLGLREIGAWFWGDFWCYFVECGVKSDRDLLGFYDTVVDTIGDEWRAWVSRDLLWRGIFQSVWRLTCLCCRADPGSSPGWKVPPSLVFHVF